MCMCAYAEKTVHVFRDMLNARATPGEDAELSCEITKPEATIRWLKDGHHIRANARYEISVEGHMVRLVIRNTTIRDSGEYCCEADGIATRARLEVRGETALLGCSALLGTWMSLC